MPRKRKRRWGTGSLLPGEGGRWRIRWKDANGRHSKSYADKDTAEEVLAKIMRAIERGEAGLPQERDDVPTLAELAKKWLARRQKTHRSYTDDKCRWNVHLSPAFGRLRPHEVDAAKLRAFIEDRLSKGGLRPATVCRCVGMLSSLFEDLKEQKHVVANPVRELPRSTRRLMHSDYDTKGTPFLQSLADVRRVFLALPEPINVAFAVGAFAGLRTGEVLALSWDNIDMEGRRIHVKRQVQDGKFTPLKDDDPRIVMLQNSLAPILAAYKLRTGGEGLLFKPTVADRGGRPDLGTVPTFMRPQTLIRHLREALKTCGLPPLTWYEATRHTFASLFVLGGGSLEMLRTLMGHSSVTTTERYSHLRPDLFTETSFHAMDVDLARPAGDVVSIRPASGQVGPTMAKTQDNTIDESTPNLAYSKQFSRA
jgi:integrase